MKRGGEDPCDFMAVFFFHHHHLKTTLINSLSSSPVGETEKDKMSLKVIQYGKKWHRVYGCNTSAAPNTSLAEPCSTEFASLEKLNNSVCARDHIHHLGGGYGKIHHCGLNTVLNDSLAVLQRHSLPLQSTVSASRDSKIPKPAWVLPISNMGKSYSEQPQSHKPKERPWDLIGIF